MPQGWITDFYEDIDVNNNFDPVTGVFTLKEDYEEGVYIFEVGAYKSGKHGKEGLIRVYKNYNSTANYLVHEIHEGDADNYSTMNSVLTLDLEKGDEVKLRNYDNHTIYVNTYHPLIFTGYKI